MKNILEFKTFKTKGQKISMVTCYDHWSAKILGQTDVDTLLVGDSLAMVVHGFDSTIHATIEMMELHVSAVARAKTNKLIVADLPFLSHRKGKKQLMNHVDRLMKAGAGAVKIELGPDQSKYARYITESGVPVIGHLGLTPQHVHQLGGYSVQGKTQDSSKHILQEAESLQEAGAHAVVLECIPSPLASQISKTLEIPTIGIGAGINVDGQVLVLHDLLGFDENFKPRFVRRFAQGEQWMKEAVQKYSHSVEKLTFPSMDETFL